MIKPKIIFVAQSGTENEYLDQSSRYRIYNPAKALSRLGYSVSVVKDRYDDDFPLYGDVYLFHRPMFSDAFISTFYKLKSLGAKLICDFDDLNFDPYTITQNAFFRIRDRSTVSDQAAMLYEGASFFDTVLTSSVKLSENARRVLGDQKSYVTIGMGVDDDLFDHINDNRDHYLRLKGRRSIGYFAGSNTHALDFPLIEKAIENFINGHALNRFILMGQIKPSRTLQAHSNFVHLPRMPYEQLFEHAATCKMIVAPLEMNQFNEVKASTKLIENCLIGAHTCASPTPEFEQTGLSYTTARTEDDWMKFISLDFMRTLDGNESVSNFNFINENLRMSVVIRQYKNAFGL